MSGKVMPGERLGLSSEFTSSTGTYISNNIIYASLLGTLTTTKTDDASILTVSRVTKLYGKKIIM